MARGLETSFEYLITYRLNLSDNNMFQQSDEEIENLHKQISNLTDENDVMKLTFSEKVQLSFSNI